MVHLNDMKQSQSSGLQLLGISLPTSSSSTPSAEVIIQILKSNSFSRSLMKKNFFTPLDKKVPLYQIILDDFKTENNNVNIYRQKKLFKKK